MCNDSACGFNIHAKFRAAAAAAAEDEAPVMEKPSWGGDSDSDEDSGEEGDESTHRSTWDTSSFGILPGLTSPGATARDGNLWKVTSFHEHTCLKTRRCVNLSKNKKIYMIHLTWCS